MRTTSSDVFHRRYPQGPPVRSHFPCLDAGGLDRHARHWRSWRISKQSTVIMQPFEFPPGFWSRDIPSNGTTIHVRSGGSGPAALLLHGYGETGDMWAPMAVDLARHHTVVVPDLRDGPFRQAKRRLR